MKAKEVSRLKAEKNKKINKAILDGLELARAGKLTLDVDIALCIKHSLSNYFNIIEKRGKK